MRHQDTSDRNLNRLFLWTAIGAVVVYAAIVFVVVF